MDKILVKKDITSPTGHSIYVGDVAVPASVTAVNLYRMYIEALDLARRLHCELNKVAQIEISSAKVKSSLGKK
jgi:phosphotransacetylase